MVRDYILLSTHDFLIKNKIFMRPLLFQRSVVLTHPVFFSKLDLRHFNECIYVLIFRWLMKMAEQSLAYFLHLDDLLGVLAYIIFKMKLDLGLHHFYCAHSVSGECRHRGTRDLATTFKKRNWLSGCAACASVTPFRLSRHHHGHLLCLSTKLSKLLLLLNKMIVDTLIMTY